jgi:hypothetical protein
MAEDPEPPAGPLGTPDPSRGGPDIQAAVENAESDSLADGAHSPAQPGEAGDSRLEQMRDVDVSSGRDDAWPGTGSPDSAAGPMPGEIGSGGAQRIVGARISDRVAGGAPPPDGPPFDADPPDDE